MTELPAVLPQALPALLDPDSLDSAAEEAVHGLIREGESKNTKVSYRAALRYWAAWYGLRYGAQFALPISPATVKQFIVDHVERQTAEGLRNELPAEIDLFLVAGKFKGRTGALALNTVRHRLAVLSALHDAHQIPNPCRDPEVRDLLVKTRRAYVKRGVTANKKPALDREALERLLATCDASLRGTRDRALLLFAWASGGRRRSEVAMATVKNVRKVRDGVYRYALPYSKTNQAGDDTPHREKPIVGRAAVALEAWLKASQIAAGPIWRRIRRGNVVGEPLSDAAVRDIVIARARLAGLEERYSAHSLRSGFVTEAGRQDKRLGDIMAMSDHASVKIAMGYFQTGAAENNSAANLLD